MGDKLRPERGSVERLSKRRDDEGDRNSRRGADPDPRADHAQRSNLLYEPAGSALEAGIRDRNRRRRPVRQSGGARGMKRRERGSALVEAAVAIPVLVLLFAGAAD